MFRCAGLEWQHLPPLDQVASHFKARTVGRCEGLVGVALAGWAWQLLGAVCMLQVAGSGGIAGELPVTHQCAKMQGVLLRLMPC